MTLKKEEESAASFVMTERTHLVSEDFSSLNNVTDLMQSSISVVSMLLVL